LIITDGHSFTQSREIALLADKLGLPETFTNRHHEFRVDRGMALAMTLAWLAFPTRKICDMEDLFHRDRRKIGA
jgi:alkanesulfonate monooxygenase SsuD/methylene tetrahydromethanopterin reductase-like flavin-dependent oxidoreductase (luciferase family)